MSGEATPSLRPERGSTTTTPPDTSDPVPDVVGTVTRPIRGSATATSPQSRRGKATPCEYAARAPFARSSAEPPPIRDEGVGRAAVHPLDQRIDERGGGLAGRLAVDVETGGGGRHGGQVGDRLLAHDRGRRGAELAQDLGQLRDHALAESDPHGELEREGLDHDPPTLPGGPSGLPDGRVGHGTGMTDAPPDLAPTTGRVPCAYAWTVVKLRWPILLGWLAAAVYGAVVLPVPAQPPDSLVSLVPPNSAALRASTLALHLFRVPLTAETEIVQRNPHGLPATVVARVFARAARVDRAALASGSGSGLIALPVVNERGVVPGSRETGTTAITYLESRAGSTPPSGPRASSAIAPTSPATATTWSA